MDHQLGWDAKLNKNQQNPRKYLLPLQVISFCGGDFLGFKQMLEISYTLNLGQLINITLDMKKKMW
jgi:hypothetical protein